MNLQSLELTLGWLYPNLMSTYGDRGNVICLQQRCRWRGITANIKPLDQQATAEDFHGVDVFIGGGAQDRQQEIVMRDLRGVKAAALQEKISAGIPGIFTCGSPQLLGHYYEPALGERIEGLGIFDLTTTHPGPKAHRCIGNLVIQITAGRLAEELTAMMGEPPPYIIGFENHGGRTQLGEVESLARIVHGYGNNGQDRTEGAFYRNAIATYSHGPVLPKNPFLADWLLQTALTEKYQEQVSLPPLDDSLAAQAREAMFKRLGIDSTL